MFKDILGILLVTAYTVTGEAQVPLRPVGPPEVAVPAASPAPQDQRAAGSSVLEQYFRVKLAAPTSDGSSHFRALRPTPMSAVWAVELENGWVQYHVLVVSGDDPMPQLGSYRIGQAQLEAILKTFAAMSVASRERIEAVLKGLGLLFNDVYAPATAPFFNNGRGIVWVPAQQQFVLTARGVVDAKANRCFKAAISLSSGEILTRVDMPCAVK